MYVKVSNIPFARLHILTMSNYLVLKHTNHLQFDVCVENACSSALSTVVSIQLVASPAALAGEALPKMSTAVLTIVHIQSTRIGQLWVLFIC